MERGKKEKKKILPLEGNRIWLLAIVSGSVLFPCRSFLCARRVSPLGRFGCLRWLMVWMLDSSAFWCLCDLEFTYALLCCLWLFLSLSPLPIPTLKISNEYESQPTSIHKKNEKEKMKEKKKPHLCVLLGSVFSFYPFFTLLCVWNAMVIYCWFGPVRFWDAGSKKVVVLVR